MRTCTACGHEGPDAHFVADKTKRSGRRNLCLRCNSEKIKAWRRANPEKAKGHKRHKGRRADQARRWRERNPGYDGARKRQLKAEAQATLGGRCRRCGEDDPVVLDIHHADHDGHEERRTMSDTTILRRARDGEGNYELLCANCHRREHSNA